ncbi:Dolichol-phosphate mannosyltransferase subunit 3 [Psilocybe cubensis]|uniref:Dolichol-phosphate mannosyltransferase subunit 3 n=1 Tax=Psilocybe cubensis TaxID=181762 RepID=A0ACB8HG68_PSICU|nr:Dolichol-phosphate mannosyltransferase subunit 3 [Psilocybe cubensis]KAH9486140.1 Dolichol-phosphate mannosyltransferase subunit 3 [Psilocybe cubensis]
MARAHRVALLGTVVVISYVLTFFKILSVPLLDAKVADQIIPVLPWWLLVSFGSYCLWSIGMGLLTLRECPEAYNELLGEITEAKNDLRMKGVTVD